MNKIVTVIGARPQFVKASVVSRALKTAGDFEEIIVHTGQHYDSNMSDIFFAQLNVPEPRFNLGIGSCGQGAQTGRMLERIEGVLIEEEPQGVVVYGDTNSTLAGALAAVKLHIPVIHVEAGLRSFNRHMPEEINRIATDAVSTLLLAPTPTAVSHLKSEGVPDERIIWTGDVMYDAVLSAAEAVKANPPTVPGLDVPDDYFLSTIHRAENTDDPERLSGIIDILARIAEQVPVLLPLHPRTRSALQRTGLMSRAETLTLIDPVGYLEMIYLMQNARAILTDSGGLQKEAFFLRKPAFIFRDETEWVELVQTGWAQLIGQIANLSAGKQADRILSVDGFRREECTAFGSGAAGAAVAQAITGHITAI